MPDDDYSRLEYTDEENAEEDPYSLESDVLGIKFNMPEKYYDTIGNWSYKDAEVQFCSSENCKMEMTDKDGIATFSSPPGNMRYTFRDCRKVTMSTPMLIKRRTITAI